ncbi:MAG TPA: tripartite tricarboxylate transporter substrate binding protein [Burkholderiales bacterium]|nr:tripartite tricarboxylate transporter substrate binding protein [Burkholderiales bacterium]
MMVIWVAICGQTLAAHAQAASTNPGQTYPNKPIRVIVGFAAGGGTDIAARTVAAPLSEALRASVVVDNRPGAGGTIGNALAAKAPADGYTLLMTANGPHVIAPNLYPSLEYDVFRDYTPVSLVASGPYVLLVHPGVAANSVSELIAWLSKQPVPAKYSSAGQGTPAHLAAELFRAAAKVQLTHVPYKGAAPALTALLGGEVDILFSDMPVAAPHLKGGRVHALAVTTSKRSALAPDLPTIAEAGVRGYEASVWYGLLAPAGTPEVVIKRLNMEVVRVLDRKEVRERFASLGSTAASSSPREFSETIRRDFDRWAKVVKDAGIKLD